MPAPEVQEERVESRPRRERHGPEDRFRILLVADPAREQDEELVAGQAQAGSQRTRSSRVRWTEIVDVDAVVQTDLASRAPLRRYLE